MPMIDAFSKLRRELSGDCEEASESGLYSGNLVQYLNDMTCKLQQKKTQLFSSSDQNALYNISKVLSD